MHKQEDRSLAGLGIKARPYLKKYNESLKKKKQLGYGSSGTAPAWQVQGPEFKL
jgi:hypothetical protein